MQIDRHRRDSPTVRDGEPLPNRVGRRRKRQHELVGKAVMRVLDFERMIEVRLG